MINNNNESRGKCALCGRTFTEPKEGEKSSIIQEVIDGTPYKFDTMDCIPMFKRFRSVYGNDFRELLGQQQQFISDPFWNRAIPTEQEIREIDKETGLDKPDILQLIRDPVEIQQIAFEIGMAARDEILIIYSTANAFDRQMKLGTIQSLKEVVERGVKTRILTPKEPLIEKTVQMLKRQNHNIEIRYSEPGLQTQVTILVVDRKSSLVVELKDDTKESSYEAMGLGAYSNRKATVLSYVSIFESVWKQTELYGKVSELCEQLKVRDKTQTEFINIAAHELRTPIQPIIGLAEILRSRKENITPPMYDEYLSVIIRNARRLKELTGNILDLARIESLSINLNKEVVDIDSVILNALQDIKSQNSNNHQVKILYDSEKGHTIFVKADKDRITQVISNLLRNAINFTKEGTITITKKKKDAGSAIITIEDTGTGIDPEILHRLFTKFTKKSDKGTGLGLYISKGIVEAHGGRIWAENNTAGKGATFTFSLPLNN
ncbi:MAG: HAMP domain-containing histidine kinase [Thermoproteota archaeon]|nr:HAMP domain-containing histidine kinase [Thermoproteota archaeon]